MTNLTFDHEDIGAIGIWLADGGEIKRIGTIYHEAHAQYDWADWAVVLDPKATADLTDSGLDAADLFRRFARWMIGESGQLAHNRRHQREERAKRIFDAED